MEHLDEGARPEQVDALVGLVEASFRDAADSDEARIVADLTRSIIATTPASDLKVCSALSDGTRRAVILFTRVRPADPGRNVFLLSPVAVATDAQGRGVGSGLIAFGLEQLRQDGVDTVVTYGDPAFYGRLGFAALDPDAVPPPHPLSQPVGWIGQALDGGAVRPMPGPLKTVPAFDRPDIW